MRVDTPSQPVGLESLAPAVPLGAGDGARLGLAESAEAIEGELSEAAAAPALQDPAMEVSSSSDAGSDGPAGPATPVAAHDLSVKRTRDEAGLGDSDEEERLRLAFLQSGQLDCPEMVLKVLASLDSPHEQSAFLEIPISDEERAAAHEKELDQLRSFDVFEEVSLDFTGGSGKPITTTWVDRRKSPTEVKGRICARDFNNGKRDDVFAATPSSCSVRVIDLLSAKYGYKKVVADVSAAFLHAAVPEDECIVVRPPDDYRSAKYPSGCLWRLKKMLYGLRGAPAKWQEHLSSVLAKSGYLRGVFEPSLFWHPAKHVYVLVHVDDLHLTGPDQAVITLVKELEKELVLKSSGLMAEGDEYSFLKAVRGMTEEAVTIWPQDSYIEETVSQLGLQHARAAGSPMTLLKAEPGDEVPLDAEQAKTYRSCIGRLLYLSHTRFDIQYACRRLCQSSRAPSGLDFRLLKHLVRYLQGTRDVGLVFPRGGDKLEFIDVYVDSDWAGKDTQRKSTSAGIVLVGGCCLTSWSRGQTVVAQSSAEAEFYAIICGAHEGLACQSMLQEIGLDLRVRVWSDSSSGRSWCHRLGAGSMKHVETKYFHIQLLMSSRRLQVEKVRGIENPADLGTKPLKASDVSKLRPLCGLMPVRGQPSTVSSVISGGVTLDPRLLQCLVGLLQLLTARSESTCSGDVCSVRPDKSDDGTFYDYMFSIIVVSAVCWWVQCVLWLTRWYHGYRASTAVITQTTASSTQTELSEIASQRNLTEVKFLYVTGSYGTCFHTTSDCRGLSSANKVLQKIPCSICCRKHDGMIVSTAFSSTTVEPRGRV
jgi:hypothetical protein